MFGISPRPYAFAEKQIETSAQISEALSEFPTTISDLISEMAEPDFSLAAQPLELDDGGELIQNPGNLRIISHIECALTSPSSECDPAIKTQIFTNATQTDGYFRYMYHQNQFTGHYQITGILRPYMAQILRGLTSRGQPVNLDDVVLNNLDMSHCVEPIDLFGMSAKRAKFTNVNMRDLKLVGVDFTGAAFTNTNLTQTNLSKTNITDATFANVQFSKTLVCELTGNQSAILGTTETVSDVTDFPDSGFSINEVTYLNGNFLRAVPDTDSFTLSAQEFTTQPAFIPDGLDTGP